MIGKIQQILFYLHRYQKLLFVLLFLIFTILAHRDLISIFPLAYGDLAPFPTSHNQAFNEYFYAWKDRGLGLFRAPGYFFNFVQGVFLFAFGSSGLAQLMFLLSVYVVGFLVTSYILRKYLKIKDEFLIFILATLYVYSPIMMGEFMGGTLYTTIFSFMFYPLLYFYTGDLVQKPNIYRFFRLLLCLGFTLSINAHMVVIYPIALIVPFLVSTIKNWKIIFNWALVLLVCILSFLFSINFFSETFGFISKTDSSGADSNFTQTIPKFLSEVKYSYTETSALNAIRGGGFMNPMEYSSSKIVYLPFFTIVLMSVAYALLSKTHDNLFVMSVLPNFSFFILIISLISLGVMNPVFTSAPFLFMFRNPAKLTASSFFYLILILAMFLQNISALQHKSLKKLAYIIILVSVAIYIKPVFTGDRGLASIASNDNIDIPSVHQEAVKDLNVLRGNSDYPRSIWLPGSHNTTSIKLFWLDQHKLEAEIGVGEFSDDYYDAVVTRAISKSLVDSDASGFKTALDNSGVGFIVILKDNQESATIETNYGATNVSSGSRQIEKVVVASGLRQLISKDDYSIYKNEAHQPLFVLNRINANTFHDVNYQKINSSKYEINVPAGSESILKMHQSFHPGWVVQSQSDELAQKINSSHTKSGIYSNSWIIPQSATDQKLAVYFLPQNKLNKSNLVAGFAYLFCLLACILTKKHEQ